jgi:hypothetical protein
MNSNYNLISKYIKYVVDPATFIKDETHQPHQQQFDVRQLQLFCYNCSTRVNVTEENSKTLPPSLFTLPIEQISFDHSPLYSGICLRPECGNTKKFYTFKF